MVLTVLENAYLRMAEQHPNFSENHKNIISLLTYKEKYYAKNELIFLTQYSENKLNKILADLEKQGLIEIEGWLIRIKKIESIF